MPAALGAALLVPLDVAARIDGPVAVRVAPGGRRAVPGWAPHASGIVSAALPHPLRGVHRGRGHGRLHSVAAVARGDIRRLLRTDGFSDGQDQSLESKLSAYLRIGQEWLNFIIAPLCGNPGQRNASDLCSQLMISHALVGEIEDFGELADRSARHLDRQRIGHRCVHLGAGLVDQLLRSPEPRQVGHIQECPERWGQIRLQLLSCDLVKPLHVLAGQIVAVRHQVAELGQKSK
mmetsp:Transcript_66467/g.177287  ORF Transcript_66467/g.177287 Transcript_66467/m.177287 type:complete len:234 (+) Transcript_66467:276-977(+)